MKNIGILVITALFFLSCNQNQKPSDASDQQQIVEKVDATRDGMLIHISESYDKPHRVLMPLKMAVMMSEDKDVLVYMDINAVELLVKDSEDLEFGEFESCHTYIRQLIDKKVEIYACPACLKKAGFESEDLMEGIQVAEKDKLFDFTKGRIITLDY